MLLVAVQICPSSGVEPPQAEPGESAASNDSVIVGYWDLVLRVSQSGNEQGSEEGASTVNALGEEAVLQHPPSAFDHLNSLWR